MMLRFNSIRVFVIIALCGMAATLGCSRTHQARGVEPTGFLGDYSKLQEGQGDQAQLTYTNPQANFRSYDKVMIDPVVMWAPPKSQLAKLSVQDSEKLKTHMVTAMQTELGKNFTLVDRPAPGVMRIRVAITEARKSRPVLDLVSNILPVGLVISGTRRILFGSHAFVGKASIEGEAVDAVSSERLLAAVDRRAGRKVLRGKFSSWNDVEEAQHSWAERIKERLVELCRGQNR